MLTILVPILHFAYHFRDYPGVSFPGIYREFTTRRVLVMEYLQGVNVLKAPLGEVDRKVVARLIADSMLKQILVDGFFHGDPHVGNIFLLKNTSSPISIAGSWVICRNTGLDFGIAIPNEFVVMSKAITTLEGTCLSLDPEINIVKYMRGFVPNTMTAGPELDDVQKLLNAVPFEVERLKQLASKYGARAISPLGNPASGVADDDHRTGRRGTDRSGLDISHGFIIAAMIYAAAILSNESGFEKWLKSVLHLPDLPVLPILCLASSGYLWLRLSRRSRPMKV